MSNNTSVSIPKDVLDSRIQAFSNAVDLPVKEVKEILKKKGIDDSSDSAVERSLTLLENREFFTFADLCEIFCDTNRIPKPVLRFGIPYLTGSPEVLSEEPSSDTASAIKELADSLKTIDKLNDKELLEKYAEQDPKVAKELSERSRGKPFIIFNSNFETVNVEQSLKMLRVARTSPKTSNTQIVDGKMKKLYRAGQYPDVLWDESPVAPGEILVDDYCEKTDTDWTGVQFESRILVRLQLEIARKRQLPFDPQKICQDAKEGCLRATCKRADAKYDELKLLGDLPKLKIRSSQIHKSVDNAGMD